MTEEFKDFTCSYPFANAIWGFNIRARSQAEAKERLKAMAWAKVDGEVIMTIDAETSVTVSPAGVVGDPIERGFLGLANGVFRVLNGYVRARNWMVRP